MRVPKVWRRPWKVTGRAPAALERRLEALEQLGAVERPAGVRVAEHEVVVGLVARSAGSGVRASAATRSASGTERLDRSVFGVPNSPRT